MVAFSDPLVSAQWHFRLLGDINTIWNEFSGADIHIGIYDDGLQYTHPDLNDNYDPSRLFSYGGVIFDDAPIALLPGMDADGHGTTVAGIIAGEAGNTLGGVGLAWGASLTGVNILSDPRFSDNTALADERLLAAYRHAASFDIMSNSWDYAPFFQSFLNRADAGSWGSATVNAFGYAVDNGRGSLGTIIVKAAGNDASNANAEGINGSRLVVNVAALTTDGQVADYSNYGTNILVSAGAASVSTDLMGPNGYNTSAGANGNYTTTFGGTSAATPVVSGVVALMLDANEGLGWRDVREILATSAALTGSIVSGNQNFEVTGTYFQANGRNSFNTQAEYLAGDTWNDGGRAYSMDYGFGRVDAFAAVRMAEVWSLFGAAQTAANETKVTAGLAAPIQFAFSSGGSANAASLNFGEHFRIENVDISIAFSFASGANAGDVSFTLLAPDGTYFPFALPYDGLTQLAANSFSWTFGIAHALGIDAFGNWTLRAEHSNITFVQPVIVNLTDLKLDFYGTAWNFDDVHHITKDFLLAHQRNAENLRDAVITDTNGGTDWINMSSIAEAVSVTLAGVGRIQVGSTQWATIAAGAAIENIVTGDGADRITGSALANTIHGMRGTDTINGLEGQDALNGGAGNDTVTGGLGNDSLYGVGGDDNLSGDAGFDLIIGGVGNDTLSGGLGNDILNAGTGNDSALGGEGNDSVIGGDGADRLAGDAGLDTLRGGLGDDTLAGGNGNDLLTGGGGNDSILGETQNDRLAGDAGNDTLNGGAGLDTLTGGIGNDLLTGGTEADTFIFGNGFGIDLVTDFIENIDTLAFAAGFWEGILDATAFVDTYAQVVGSTVVFDFEDGNVVTLSNTPTLAILYDDISIA